METNREKEKRHQLTKMALLTVLVFLSMFGAVGSYSDGLWPLSILFLIMAGKASMLLNRSTEGYLFIRRLQAERLTAVART